MKWTDKKSGEKQFMDSGCIHNPVASTPRGKRRAAKREEKNKSATTPKESDSNTEAKPA